MDDPIAPHAAVPSPTTRSRWRGVTLALTVACVGWLSLWSALRVQAAPNALIYPSALAPCNTTLQACVDAVAAGDTLLILPSPYAIPELTIPRAMTIQGAGVVLQAAGAHRVVNIAAGQGPVTLIGLTIRNGRGAANGGGILIGNDTPVQLINVIVRDNQSSGDGGGLYAGTGANLQLIGATVTNNRAPGGSGGGLISLANRQVVVTASSIVSNSTLSHGAGMHVYGPLIIVASQIASNTVSGGAHGGGVYASSGATLSGTTVISNVAGGDGGGLYATASLAIANSQVSHNRALDDGGGIYAERVDLSHTVVATNTAEDSGGGVVSIGALSVTGGEVANNIADFIGGGLRASSEATLTQVMVRDNRSDTANGGGIRVDGWLAMNGGEVRNNQAFSFGGGLSLLSGGEISGTQFLANTAGAGGGVAVFGGPAIDFSVPFTGTNLRVTGNEALLGNGGGIFTDGFVTITLQGAPGTLDLQVSGNRAAESGGGVYVDGPAVVNNCLFTGNEADFGGGLFAYGDVIVTGCLIDGNTAITDGGGVFGSGDVTTILSSTVRFNGAAQSAGGVWAESAARVDNAAFIANHSGATGGGLHSNGGHSLVVSATFTANTVADLVVDGDEQGGGGIYQSGGSLTLQGVTLSNNQSQSDGGGIAARAPVTITGGSFFANAAASSGGGMAVQGNTTISHTVFSGNVGRLSGALIASGQSGNPITLTVLNSLFHSNGYTQTNTYAVGAEMKVFDADLLLVNNTFADPQLPAGAIFRHGVQVFRSAVQAHNNIFANYPTHGLGHGDPAPVASTLGEDHNLFFDAPLGNFGGNLTAGGNSLTADARFVDAAAGNYRLRGDSPAIDAGLDSALPPALAVDLDGQPRRFDGPPVSANLVDIGAYESRKVGPVAVPGGPYAGFEGSSVALDATGSSGDAPLTFAWDCTDDGAIDQALATPTGASCLYPDNGSFSVRLVLTDGEPVSVTAHTSATIANVAPTVSAPGNQMAQAAVVAQFDLGSFTDPGPDAPWAVVVDWGDSTPTTQFPQNSAGPIAAQVHTYAAPGEYTVTVAVTDKDTGSHSATFRALVTSVMEHIYLPLVSR